jgi:hypothetical protein
MLQLIDRRRFLQMLVGTALVGITLASAGMASGSGLGASHVQAQAEPSASRRVLTREFHLSLSEPGQGSQSGLTVGANGLSLEDGRDVGHFVSRAIKSDLLFDYVGLSWSSSNVDGGSARFWVRTSPDGRSWSQWQAVEVEDPPSPTAEYDTYGSLVWADRASYVQFLGELRGAGKDLAVDRVGLTLLNPYDGPIVGAEGDVSDGGSANAPSGAKADSFLEEGHTQAASSGKPVTFTREQWGADESLRFSGGEEVWPPSYVPTKKLIVHHTATGNYYSTVEDAKAMVRAIYTYHARSLEWGDIGYNILVDKFGNTYEGRRGRDGPGYDGPGGREILSEDVVAGHALAYNYGSSGIALLGTFCTAGECSGGGSPTAAMITRLKDVLEWESRNHGINPQGASDFLLWDGAWHRDLPNIVGHRDVGSTSCPGGNLYALLPQLRSEVATRLAAPGGPTVSITFAPPEGTVTNGNVEFAWRGSGGSGGLEYSYYLEGWSKASGTSEVTYLRGFDSRQSPEWSPWTRQTSARLCYVSRGLYTFHVRVRDSTGRVGVYSDSRTFLGRAQATACSLSCDFNGDGFGDLAIGAPGEDIGTIQDAGAVNVLYGSQSGLTGAADQLWHQNSPGVQGEGEAGDLFGLTLSCGDYDGDGYSDLAIGAEWEDVEDIADAGAVNVLYGSPSGLTDAGDQLWHQDSIGVQGEVEAEDRFGSALFSGDYDGDGYSDLAIGAKGEDVGAIADAGAVNVLYGSPSGLTAARDQLWHQDSIGVKGEAEAEDWFGSALFSGDYDGDGYGDLAIGAKGEDVGAIADAGAVNVLYGSPSGLTDVGDQLWHQNSPGVQGEAEAEDWFGSALSSGDYDYDGYGDLAIGAKGEDVEVTADAGAVNVLYGSPSGLTGAGDQLWHQDSIGVQGEVEAEDWFGSALFSGDYDGDDYGDLAIGAKGEDVGAIADAGAVNVLYGSPAGLTDAGDQLWHQDSTGVQGEAEAEDWFGSALSSGDDGGDGYGDIAIGGKAEDVGAIGDAGVINGADLALGPVGRVPGAGGRDIGSRLVADDGLGRRSLQTAVFLRSIRLRL